VCFFRQDLSVGTNRFDLVTLTFPNLSIVFSLTLILHMRVSCVTNPFSGHQQVWPCDLYVWLTENLNLGCIFWMVCTRTLIFYMSDEWPYHEFQKIWPCDLNLDVWPTYWKLTLGITFQSYIPGLGSLWHNLSMAIDVNTVIKQVIWWCVLSIWPIFQKLWCRHGCQWNLSLSGAFVFHKHILLFSSL
jgi:hypothetical protein